MSPIAADDVIRLRALGEADLAAHAAGTSDVVDLGIELVTTGELAGVVGIQRRLPYLTESQVNLTYAVYPPHRSHGIATRAVRLAIDLAASRWPNPEFIIRCDAANEASAAVARALGFTYLGRRDEQEGIVDCYVGP